MQNINTYLIEKLKLDKSLTPLKHIVDIDFPVCDSIDGDIEDKTWRKFTLPFYKYIIYKDAYRGMMPHLSDFKDFIMGIQYFQDDYEDYDFTSSENILYASDDLKKILEWYMDYLNVKYPTPDDDEDVWIDKNEKKFNHVNDNPACIYEFYTGEDTYYDNIPDLDKSSFETRKALMKILPEF